MPPYPPAIKTVLTALCVMGLWGPAEVRALDTALLAEAVQAEAQGLNARIGMAVIDTRDGQRWQVRGHERFPLNSTHKALTCAALLHQVDQSRQVLSQPVAVRPAALVDYSPVTAKHLFPETMTLQALCEAAVSVSDNTAANLVTSALGGPVALTGFLRSLGDTTTRIDRLEPELNSALPQDERDTTTPAAVVETLHQLLLGDVLTRPSRGLLTEWMLQDQVADDLLRAALPPGWRIADKSGAGGHGSRSIVAVLWPADRAPVVVGIYMTHTPAPMRERDAAMARMGTALVQAIRP